MKKWFVAVLLTVLAALFAACGPAATPEPTEAPTEEPTEEPMEEPTDEPEPTEEEMEEPGTIVDIASGDEQFSTLVDLLGQAGLAETLAGEGPYTVFAPTNAAFEAVPEETLTALQEDPELLEQVLLYHVVDGAVFAEDVVALESATTLQGEDIAISVEEETVTLNGNATVTATDIEASNGVIHVIDAVILPPSVADGGEEGEESEEAEAQTIADIVASTEEFSTLRAALEAAGLVETFQGEGPFTVFAPTNAAFEALPEGTLDELLADTEQLTAVLQYHVVEGEVTSTDIVENELEAATTLEGSDITISLVDGNVVLNPDTNNATVTTPDVEAANGVIHIIDAVLTPSE